MTSPQKRLIEVTLPLAEISVQSAREKSIRHGHISTLHIWWARRPLAAMRAAIFASLIPDPGDDEKRKKLEDLIKIIVDWDQVKDGNSTKIEEAKELIRQAFPDGPPRLLDPFMGGGATGLEALRLGCETHAVELNPVAHLIELCTLVYPQQYGQPEKRLVQHGAVEVEEWVNPLAEDVRKWGRWVLERAREEIGHLYANPAGPDTIVGYLWARTVTCPNPACRVEMPLVRQWWLARSNSRKIAVMPIVNSTVRQLSFDVVDLNKESIHPGFDPDVGTIARGDAVCLVCNQSVDGAFLRRVGSDGSFGQRMIAVINEGPNNSKQYRAATTSDEMLYAKSHEILHTIGGVELLPDELIDPRRPSSAARGLSAVTRYGLRSFRDLFNSRQQLILLTLRKSIRESHGRMRAEHWRR